MLCRGCCCTMGPAPVAQCPSCGLPRCCPKCDQNGHHRAECAALQRGKFKLGAGGMGGLSTSAWFGLAMLRTYLWAREHPRLEEALTRHDLSQDDEVSGAHAAGRSRRRRCQRARLARVSPPASHPMGSSTPPSPLVRGVVYGGSRVSINQLPPRGNGVRSGYGKSVPVWRTSVPHQEYRAENNDS
ncbi:hypothetical protein ONE63_000116 [Megalurothrips usitatus]|uniref:CCHC-type domain-containing protein n=1 Tax=Megalurothrips usitatus TaxID=439358 RepID=A0AAV7Y4M0_9NEOP|nr:hypothetical protein ONE63_000116 [Megalurothrips usitatus]